MGKKVVFSKLKAVNLQDILPQPKTKKMPPASTTTKSKKGNFLSSSVGITLIIGTVVAFILPIILTQFQSGIDFTQTGQIGDTIGGIAGPILNITGLIIVYFSFQQQLEANNKQWLAFKNERSKSRREENFADIEKAINLLSKDIRTHKPTFLAVTQIIEHIEGWYAPQDPGDVLQVKELMQATGYTWNGKFIKSPEDYWSMFNEFNWLARYLDSQYSNIIIDINGSSLSESRRQLLRSSLRNKCILPTYKWLTEETMQQLWDRDENKFQDVEIVSIMNRLRVHTPMIFPAVIRPFKLDSK